MATSYLLKRGGSYSFRIAIPKALRTRFKAAELKRSLQTKHLYEAKERASQLLTSVHELFKIVIYVDIQLFSEELGEGSVRKIKDVTAAHVEHIIKKQHVDRSDITHTRSNNTSCPRVKACLKFLPLKPSESGFKNLDSPPIPEFDV